MNNSSRFYQITEYALLEYIYNDKVVNTKDCNFLRVFNQYTGTLAFMNYNPTNNALVDRLTNNSLERTALQIEDTRWLRFDFNRPIKFFERRYSRLKFDRVYEALSQDVDVVYDTIKIHIVSGYNFEDLGGFILRASYFDAPRGEQLFVLNQAFLKEENSTKFNKNPIFIGNRSYNRYVEVSFPSLRDLSTVNQVLESVLNDGVSTPVLDLKTAMVNILYHEIIDIRSGDSGETLLITDVPNAATSRHQLRLELPQYDSYAKIAVVVQESSEGDYFEIYPTFNGQFLEDFIQEKRRNGSIISVAHDIEVYEQLINYGDVEDLLTSRFTSFQDDKFDQPFAYRPIIKNSNAYSFTIDYTLRILDKLDNSQIIKRGSLIYPNAKKYGKKLTKLDVGEGLRPIKIVNKLQRSSDQATMFSDYSLPGGGSQVKTTDNYIPVSLLNLSLNSSTLYVDNLTDLNITFEGRPNKTMSTLNFKDLPQSQGIYGMGDGVIYLSRFDNYVKLKLFQYDYTKQQSPAVYSELRKNQNISYFLVFQDVDGVEIKIEEFNPSLLSNFSLQEGELVFKINSSNSRAILNSGSGFSLVLENQRIVPTENKSIWNTKREHQILLYSGKTAALDAGVDVGDITTKTKLIDERLAVLSVTKNNLDKLKLDLETELNTLIQTSPNNLEDLKRYLNQLEELSKAFS